MAVQLNRWARTGQRPSVRDEIVRGGRHVMVRTTADAEPQSWVLVFVAEDQEAAAEDLPGACCAVETTRAAFLEDVHSRGLVAAPLRTAEEILFDPDLNRRQLYQVVNRPSVGPLPYASAAPVLLDGQPLARRDLSPPARLGEHTAEILADLLGVSPAQYQELVERHITGEAPVGKQKSFLRWPLRMDELERRGRVRSDPAAAEKLARHFNYRLAEPTGTELKKDELA
jgi:hypothetical protein